MALAVGRSCFYWCQKAFCWVSFSPGFSTIPQAGQRGLNNTVKRMCREAFHPLVGEFSNIENCSLRSVLSKNNKRWEGPTAPLGSLSTLNLGKQGCALSSAVSYWPAVLWARILRPSRRQDIHSVCSGLLVQLCQLCHLVAASSHQHHGNYVINNLAWGQHLSVITGWGGLWDQRVYIMTKFLVLETLKQRPA